jgi:hypothetical protein
VSQEREANQQSQKNYIDNSPDRVSDDLRFMSASLQVSAYFLFPHKGWGILNVGIGSTLPYYEDLFGDNFDPAKQQKVYIYAGRQSIEKTRELATNQLSGYDYLRGMSGTKFYDHYTVTGIKYQEHIVPRQWGLNEINNQFGKNNWSYRDLTERPGSKDINLKDEISNIISSDKSLDNQQKSDIAAIRAKMLKPAQTKVLEK